MKTAVCGRPVIYEVVEWLENSVTTWHVVDVRGHCVRVFDNKAQADERCAELNDFG